MATIFIFDYIVVHELVHFKYNNHSKDFWKSIKVIIPDYE